MNFDAEKVILWFFFICSYTSNCNKSIAYHMYSQFCMTMALQKPRKKSQWKTIREEIANVITTKSDIRWKEDLEKSKESVNWSANTVNYMKKCVWAKFWTVFLKKHILLVCSVGRLLCIFSTFPHLETR
jgi:hypothetical protein